jgi:phage terminase large subunit-like protein
VAAHPPAVPERAYALRFSDGSEIVAGGEHLWATWTHADRKAYNRNVGAPDFPDDWPVWRSTQGPPARHRQQWPEMEQALRLVREGRSLRAAARASGVSRNALSARLASPAPTARPTGIGARIRTTDEIADTLLQGRRGDRNHCIPLARPLELPRSRDLPVPPYTLGYWLGDGSTGGGRLTCHTDDQPELVAALAADGHPVRRLSGDPRGYSVAADGLHSRLRAAGVLHDKHIPPAYLRASADQRLALLQGLMDSDGSVHAVNGCAEFTTVRPALAQQVLELVRSLSEKPVLAEGVATLDGRPVGPKYRITWRPSFYAPFRLLRKAARLHPPGAQALRNRHRMITAAVPVPPVPMRCITVDSPQSMYLAGDAMVPTHNTATEVEWLRGHLRAATSARPQRIALVARTAADVRDVLVQGESGILARTPPSEAPLWEPSKRLLTWPDGHQALCFSSEEPSQLRGPQFHAALCDELAAWRWIADDSGLTAWDNVQIATRLGENPQIVVGTTPKRLPAIRTLLADAALPGNPKRIVVTRGSTRDNLGNLSATYVDTVYGLFSGTRLARQELDGVLLDDVEGALWSLPAIDGDRLPALPSGALQYVVGVDPSVAENPTDLCGIVVCASTVHRNLHERQLYVVHDASVLGSPNIWAEAVVRTARAYGAPVVAEVNQGGALVRSALTSVDPGVRVFDVRARYGKLTRAEPVALVYDQHRAHHIGLLPELEDELTTWVPGETRKSPDRLDALVHAATALLVAPPPGLHSGPISSSSPNISAASAAPVQPPDSPFARRPSRSSPSRSRRRARVRIPLPASRTDPSPSPQPPATLGM